MRGSLEISVIFVTILKLLNPTTGQSPTPPVYTNRINADPYSVSYNFLQQPIGSTYNLQEHPLTAAGGFKFQQPLQPGQATLVPINNPNANVVNPNNQKSPAPTLVSGFVPVHPNALVYQQQHGVPVVEGVRGVTAGTTGGKKYHSCYRDCSSDPATRMTCTYKFTVANYYVLSPHCRQCPNVTADCYRHGCLAADGRQRVVSVVNKILPGPAIRVCQGDTVVVDVTNKLGGQETTIHWHGIHQMSTPWMDGVPNLTQCPIPQETTFRYNFETPKGGTYFWHSHSGTQRADGVFGMLTVRRSADEDVHYNLYDFDLAEHELIVWDWLRDLAIVSHIQGHVSDQRELPRSILVNGKGIPPGFFDDFLPYDTLQTRGKPFVPLHEIRVRQGASYRIRLISNGVTLCPVELSIENHAMLIISADGFDVQPVSVQSVVIHAGERWDFVIQADQPVGSYWMKFRGLIDCNMTQTFQLALLNYEGTPQGAMPAHTITTWDEAGPASQGLALNPVNVAPGVPGQSLTIAEMSSVIDYDPEITQRAVPDHQFYLAFDFNRVPNVNFGLDPKKHFLKVFKESKRKGGRGGNQIEPIVHFLPQLNFISHTMPSSPPLTQPESIPETQKCNIESKRAQGIDCTEQHCKCTHLLKVQLNSIVEMVLVDMGVRFDAAHPFHLHGHSFRVVGLERLGNTTDAATIQQWDAQGLLPRRRTHVPVKDTVYVPDGGYTILRWRANNPGFWFFHCHIEFHSERGMALIVQVGEPNQTPRPPADFPTCGNYVPPIEGPGHSFRYQ